MLLSIAIILLLGMMSGFVFRKIKLPPLMGMLIIGIIIGPYCFNIIDSSIIDISSQIRRICLIIILLRAGLNLKLEDLKKVGRPAIMMCFIPATLEILGMVIVAPIIFDLSLIDALILGTVIAAVSPAVIVPHMLKLMDEGYGTNEGIPQMILAGASADDVFVIVLFSSFTSIATTGSFNPLSLLRIPTSIILGILVGAILGYLLARYLKLSVPYMILIFLSLSFILVTIEDQLTGIIGFSGLIAVMALGLVYSRYNSLSIQISNTLSKMWIFAEIFLFVLVGAAVNIQYAYQSGIQAIILILLVLLFRMLGVLICMIHTNLNRKERLFCALAYTPKATVQAAIGAIPLSLGLASGELILTVAVVAILLTAPLGAFMIDMTYKRYLHKV